MENRAYDLCFRLAHWYSGRVEASPEIGLVAIDDRSVNPDYSPYSSKYGDDGWRTRDLWDLHVKQMGANLSTEGAGLRHTFQSGGNQGGKRRPEEC
jgi:hypothetical protein